MKKVKVGIIGGGLMGREAASAFARWFAFTDMPVKPELLAVCDLDQDLLEWYRQVPGTRQLVTNYRELLDNPELEVIYVAVPHHLHEQIYTEVLLAGKDLLAEKPFGIDLKAAFNIVETARSTGRFVRCSSEFPFLPGAQQIFQSVGRQPMGKLLHIKSGFHHSSDLDPQKPLNWKRQIKYCGETGVMADLGMHALHMPLRMGFKPLRVYAQLQNIYETRPNGQGGTAPCDTWDNATLHCTIEANGRHVPMQIETKRMAPTETNTWYFEVLGTDGGMKYSTKEPKTLWHYHRNNDEQLWQKTDLGFASVFPTITGKIFEPGFPDCFMQMLGAFFAEREGALNGRFGCATPEEALDSQRLFHAALQSQKQNSVVEINY